RLENADLAAKLAAVFAAAPPFAGSDDAEQSLYSGFCGDGDRALMASVRSASAEQLASGAFAFSDQRLAAMLPRYRARNFADTLSVDERRSWQAFCRARLHGEGGGLTLADYRADLATLRASHRDDDAKLQLLAEL